MPPEQYHIFSMTKNLESAVVHFLALASELQTDPSTTAESALTRIAEFYTGIRITAAEIDDDGDMLLFQWGASSPITECETPIDLRGETDFEEGSAEFGYLDFTRQVNPENEDDDFDDSAIQMSVTLFYEPATGDESMDNQWICSPQELDEGIEKLRKDTFVAKVLSAKPSRIIAFVDNCG